MANVLITGCNSGFGYYTAEYFAKAGHHVFATVRKTADTTELQKLADDEDLSIELVTLEVTDSDQVLKVRDYVLSKGPLDILINNAGRVVIAPYEEISEQQIRDIFEVNVFGLSNMIQAFLPSMRANNAGTIVNLSSPIAVVPSHWYGVYAASKAAVDALSKTLALELAGWNIRLMVIYPGNYKTAVLNNAVGSLKVSEDSPYFELKQRTKQASREIYANFLGSEEERAQRETGRPVGDAIFNAVFDGTMNMHYPVGADAQGVWDNRIHS
ncbi:MAG: SDR family oxidoreductase [Pseudomonadales bacterium]